MVDLEQAIDLMRDVYMTREQRAAFDRILAAHAELADYGQAALIISVERAEFRIRAEKAEAELAALREAFLHERAALYRAKGGMKGEQARIHAETDLRLILLPASVRGEVEGG